MSRTWNSHGSLMLPLQKALLAKRMLDFCVLPSRLTQTSQIGSGQKNNTATWEQVCTYGNLSSSCK
ncbi:hypothetical protein C8Q74DRAFT_1274451 [Fomes fomentarius]|nr:hypothetical protein C8Q74DRAFT_1274451 [Fomes fomentarius]